MSSKSSPVAGIPAAKDFLFVNETGPSTEFKVGYRPDIRSHVRKHVAREFKQKHKNARRIEEADSDRQWQPLLPQAVVQGHLRDPIRVPYCGIIPMQFIPSRVTESSDATEPVCDRDSRLYGKACKQEFRCPNINHCLNRKSRTIVLNKQELKNQPNPSPLEILGAGRSDPFSTYPTRLSSRPGRSSSSY
jgi:hypothetical protein